jgi:hypothetical protein
MMKRLKILTIFRGTDLNHTGSILPSKRFAIVATCHEDAPVSDGLLP